MVLTETIRLYPTREQKSLIESTLSEYIRAVNETITWIYAVLDRSWDPDHFFYADKWMVFAGFGVLFSDVDRL